MSISVAHRILRSVYYCTLHRHSRSKENFSNNFHCDGMIYILSAIQNKNNAKCISFWKMQRTHKIGSYAVNLFDWNLIKSESVVSAKPVLIKVLAKEMVCFCVYRFVWCGCERFFFHLNSGKKFNFMLSFAGLTYLNQSIRFCYSVCILLVGAAAAVIEEVN